MARKRKRKQKYKAQSGDRSKNSQQSSTTAEKVGIVFESSPEDLELMEKALRDPELPASLQDKIRKDQARPQQPSSKRKKSANANKIPEYQIDLHGYSLSQAIEIIDKKFVQFAISANNDISIKIITGKGLHSDNGKGVLNQEVHQYIISRYGDRIKKIDESPAKVTLGGIPIRGFFTVILKNK